MSDGIKNTKASGDLTRSMLECNIPVDTGTPVKGSADSGYGAVALGPMAYLIQLELDMYEMLTKNMQLFNELSSKSATMTLQMGTASANAAEASIMADAEKERGYGGAAIATGASTLGGTFGLQAKRFAKGSTLQEKIKSCDTQIDTLHQNIGLVDRQRGVTLSTTDTNTVGGKFATLTAEQQAAKIKKYKEQLTNRNLTDGPLTRKELDKIALIEQHGSAAGGALEDKYFGERLKKRMHEEVREIKTERQSYQTQLDNNENKAQQLGQMGKVASDAGSNFAAATQDEEKKVQEKIRILAQANQENQKTQQQQSQETRSQAERQQESVLQKMEKMDQNNQSGR